MNQALRSKILAYNQVIQEKGRKANDLDTLIAGFLKLPPGQLNKLLTEEVLAILKKYGVDI